MCSTPYVLKSSLKTVKSFKGLSLKTANLYKVKRLSNQNQLPVRVKNINVTVHLIIANIEFKQTMLHVFDRIMLFHFRTYIPPSQNKSITYFIN